MVIYNPIDIDTREDGCPVSRVHLCTNLLNVIGA